VDLNGKVALVTGASRGIGRAIARKLARAGATVAVHYGAAADLARAAVLEIEQAGGRAFALEADLRQLDGAARLVSRLHERLAALGLPAEINILVNNAGVARRVALAELSDEEFDGTLAVNLRAPFQLIRAFSERMPKGGRIINVSSMVTRAAYPDYAAYASSKAGLESLTLTLAPALGAKGITINAVRPGATLTEMNAGLADPVRAEQVRQTIALGRIGLPDDVADVVAFLASDEARWVTGQCIDASGGQRL
jgi:3-oxoacyl-[acyl-carrier protein] reductase